MKNLGVEYLVGRKVLAARINDEKDFIELETDKGKLFLTWEGSCCAHCFLATVTGAANLVGATILSAENAEWRDISKPDEEYGETVETMGTNIRTDRGFVTFESRVEHNGYYGGEILVSDDEPMDQYHSPRYQNDEERPPMTPLTDF